MHKALVVICDGMPDRPLKELDNRTPLEIANTPNLDRIAVDGISGMMHTVGIGVRPGSDTAHLAIFGYDPYVYYSGRGPYECAGIGMDVRAGDVALRANAGTIDASEVVTDRRAGRIASTKELVDYIGTQEIDGVTCMLQSSLGHRIGMVLRGPGLSPKITDQDPHKTGVGPLVVAPLDESPEAKRTADIANKFSKLFIEKLTNAPFNSARVADGQLPANVILFRGAGTVAGELVSFYDKFHLKASFVAGAPMYRGIAKILGMDVVFFDEVESGVTGLANSNLNNKVSRALQELETHDIVFMHIKAADSLAEDGNVKGKIAFIEQLDAALKPIAELEDVITVVTADHTTSCALQKHTADPVPLTIKGPGIRTDDINAYTERECARGRLGSLRGLNVMPIVIDLMGASELYGA